MKSIDDIRPVLADLQVRLVLELPEAGCSPELLKDKCFGDLAQHYEYRCVVLFNMCNVMGFWGNQEWAFPNVRIEIVATRSRVKRKTFQMTIYVCVCVCV